MSWSPILEGPEATAAIDTIEQIADQLLALKPNEPAEVVSLSLFWAYLGESDLASRFRKQRQESLEALIEECETIERISLIGGLCGIQWVLQHLVDDDVEPLRESLDAVILRAVKQSSGSHEYDLVSGLVGVGVCQLSRVPRRTAVDTLASIVEALDRQGERQRDRGRRWPSVRAPARQVRYDLGLAHGVCGLIAFLSAILERELAGPIVATARRLLTDAVQFLLSTEGTSPVRYPGCLDGEGQPLGLRRSGWCYGDLGVSVALWRAGNALKAPSLCSRGLGVALETCKRQPFEVGVQDAHLCHGAIGFAHISNRFFQVSGDLRFRDLSRRWYEHALRSRRNDGLTGFPAFTNDTNSWESKLGLLTGATGIGLALLAAVSDLEPAWDSLLLTDIRGSD